MLDLETLATSPDALVVSVGAVIFDPNTDVLGPTFYAELSDLPLQQERGRRIDANTVVWWMAQDAMARQVFAEKPDDAPNRLTTSGALLSFMELVAAAGGRDARIWGNGADFDNIIWGSLYGDFGLKRPWSYSKNRCFRTMKAGYPHVKVAREGVHHNALDDAITQAKHLQAIMKAMKT